MTSRVATVLAAVLAVAIFCVSSIPGSGLPKGISPYTTLAHFCEYMILGALVTVASYGRTNRTSARAALAIGLSSAYGASDEFHQMFVPGRTTDVLDWVADTAGAAVGFALATMVLNLLKRRGRLG